MVTTAIEQHIEGLLRENLGQVVTRETLYRQVFGITPEMQVHTRTLDVHVCRLRKKLEGRAVIKCVRGKGYKLELDGDDD